MSSIQASPPDGHGGRGFSLGRRWAFLAACGAALLAAALIVIAIKPGGGSSGTIDIGGHQLPLTKKFGHPASWIKIPTAPTPTVATATAKAPQLHAIEGYPVRAVLPQGSVQLSVVGPVTPSAPASNAHGVRGTFFVTFSAALGAVPLAAKDFTVVTYAGQLLHPKVSTSTGAPLPSHLTPGHQLIVKLTASGIPDGDGEVRWGPVNRRILVAYFWTLEDD